MKTAVTESSTRGRAARYLAHFLLLALGPAAMMQARTLEQNPNAPGYVHEKFDVGDGLPSAGLTNVVQTRDGYLWLSTFDGLVRYDGARFEILRSDEYPALRSNRIGTLLEDRHGTLWILVDSGYLVRYREGRFTSCGPSPEGISCALPASDAKGFKIHQTPDGALWFAWEGQVFRLDSEDPVPTKVANLASAAEALEIVDDLQGRLWIVTRDRLWQGRWKTYEGSPFVQLDRGVNDLGVDDQGTLWISRGAEIGTLGAEGFIPVHRRFGASILEDPRGGLWCSTSDRRLYRVLGGEWKLIAEDPEIYGQAILGQLNLLVTPEGSTWVAWGRFLLRDGAIVAQVEPDMSHISSVTLDRHGTVWATGIAAGELHAFHPMRLETLVDGMPNTATTQVFEDTDGTLWTGQRHLLALAPGAVRFEIVARTEETSRAMLRDREGVLWASFGWELPGPDVLEWLEIAVPGESISALLQSRDGELWAAGWNGLFHHEGSGEWKPVQPTTGPRLPGVVRVIRETDDGALWLATAGEGLARWHEGRATVVTHHQGLASDHLRAIWIAPEGHLWIATEDRGLSRLDPASVEDPDGPSIVNVDRRHGLFVNGIHQIVDDRLGNLWMSSNEGIFRVRRQELEAVADAIAAGQEPTQLVSVVYDERDGMRTREANGGVLASGLRDRQGRIVFPTMDGVVRLDPRELTQAREPPPMYIESLRLGSSRKALRNGDELRLEPQQRSFALTYTAPTFRAADRLRFRYRLTPFDGTWIDAGPRREAAYTKVPPGRYTFEVAVNAEGVWSEPASITLEAVPYFYETGWFRLLGALLGLGLIFGWARRREYQERAQRRVLEAEVRDRTATIHRQAEKLRELDKLKSQFFANVSHEFRTPLTLVLGPLRDVLDGSFGELGEGLVEQLSLAEDNAERVLGLVDQLLEVARLDAGGLRLRLQKIDSNRFLRRRVEALQPLAERQRVKLRLLLPARSVEMAADPTQLAKVIDNLLINAVKFSPPGETVDVSLEVPDGEHLEVRVRDRGRGIPADQREKIFERFYQLEPNEEIPGSGLGLALARQLAELHGGRLSVSTPTDGPGVCFTVTLRRGDQHGDATSLTAELPAAVGEGEVGEGTKLALSNPPAVLVPARHPGPSEVEIAERSSGRDRVLIVDDNADIRAYLRSHLSKTFEVSEAADGEQALALAQENPPELVISDIMMPGLDGTELFHALRGDPRLESIPVILVTAKASPDSRIQGLREGIDDYLVKPFDPRELVARAENVIAARQRSSKPPRGLQVSEIATDPAGQSFLERVKGIIESRIADKDLNVEALANAVGCERSHLLRRLRDLTDETPSGLIRAMRMQRAAQLLVSELCTVSEVAARVGFKSVPHFSTTFFKYFGERPKIYAERHRASHSASDWDRASSD